MTEHSFIVHIQKWHKLSFENSSDKVSSFKLCKLILGMAGVCGLLKIQLCIMGLTTVWPRGSEPLKFLVYILVFALRGGDPKQILLLA